MKFLIDAQLPRRRLPPGPPVARSHPPLPRGPHRLRHRPRPPRPLLFRRNGHGGRTVKAPDVQWERFHAFAEGHGTFDWSNDSASHRIQKRKETLSKKLQDHFGIRAAPFLYDKSTGGWQAVFNLKPEE